VRVCLSHCVCVCVCVCVNPARRTLNANFRKWRGKKKRKRNAADTQHVEQKSSSKVNEEGRKEAEVDFLDRPQLEAAFFSRSTKGKPKCNWQWQSVDSAKINNLKWFSCKHINVPQNLKPNKHKPAKIYESKQKQQHKRKNLSRERKL